MTEQQQTTGVTAASRPRESANPWDEIANRFVYHPPGPEAREAHEGVRAQYLDLVRYVYVHTKPGRHQALALTALQESMFWCNASIACDGLPPVPGL